jgi:type IV pilus assembly protein PilC
MAYDRSQARACKQAAALRTRNGSPAFDPYILAPGSYHFEVTISTRIQFAAADFYEQLALMLEAGLPLPDAVGEIAAQVPDAEFQQSLGVLADRLKAGEALADTLKAVPKLASDAYLLSIAERGELSALLKTAGHARRQAAAFAEKLRLCALPPLFMLLLTLALQLCLCSFVIPHFGQLVDEMSLATTTVTSLVIAISAILQAAFWPLLGLWCVVFAGFLWLTRQGERQDQVLLTLIRRLPGWRQAVAEHAYAQIADLWALLFAHETRVPALLEASVVLAPRNLARHLPDWADDVRSGKTLAEIANEDSAFPAFLGKALQFGAVGDLPATFADASNIYRARGDRQLAVASALWRIVLVFATGFAMTVLIIGAMLPLIQMLAQLGG